MLEVGEYKNYKAICESLGWEIKAGNSKKKQLKDLECMCKYHKEGSKFIIEEVYKDFTLIERRGREAGVTTKEYPQLNIEEDKHCNYGIYMIKLDNQIYI